MSSDAPILPCRACGVPKRIDTECTSTPECIERTRIWREELDHAFRAGNPEGKGNE